MIIIKTTTFEDIIIILEKFGVSRQNFYQYGLDSSNRLAPYCYQLNEHGQWMKYLNTDGSEKLFKNETNAINDWFITFKNDPVVSQFHYHGFTYKNILCDIVQFGNKCLLITSDCFLSVALEQGFKNDGGLLQKEIELHNIVGYKNFGYVIINSENVYWFCESSNVSSSFPTHLNYFKISENEYMNKYVFQSNISSSFFLTLSIQEAQIKYIEEEKIIKAILNPQPMSDLSTIEPTINTINTDIDNDNKKKKKQKKEKKVKTQEIANTSKPVQQKKKKREKKKRRGGCLVIGLVLLILLGITGFISYPLIEKYIPGTEKKDMNEYYNIENEDDVAIVWDHSIYDEKAKLINNSVYFTYDFIHNNINSTLYYDSNENLLLYATGNDIVKTTSDTKTYTANGVESTFKDMIYTVKGDDVWISAEYIEQYSNFEYQLYANPNRITLDTNITPISLELMNPTKNTSIRYQGGTKSPILTKVTTEDSLIVLERDEKWTKVETEDGIIGYIMTMFVGETEPTTKHYILKDEVEIPHNFADETVSLAWHQVTNKESNKTIDEVLKERKNINVISPTWFYLNDNNGNIADIGSKEYVDYCHSKNIDVWGLVSNLENAEVDTTKVLTTTSLRTHLIDQIVNAAKKYNLDGVNIDFESLSVDAGTGFIQFIRELSLKLDDTNIILSVDNYVPAEYTKFYNRAEQAKFADYVVIMAYDEHNSTSETTGSVDSLAWVAEGVENTLAEVPSNQIILGIPLYTRVWKTNNSGISSQTYGMTAVNNIIKNHNASIKWDDYAGQNYATYKIDNDSYEIWVQDTMSISKRLDIMQNEALAGAAFWKIGFEQTSVWDSMSSYFK